MIAATVQEQKRARFRFFALYFMSVVLIVLIIAALWKADPQPEPSVAVMPATVEAPSEDYATLQTKLFEMDGLYSGLAQSKDGGAAIQKSMQSAEAGFNASLDSLQKLADDQADPGQRAKMAGLIAGFRKSLQSRMGLVNDYVAAQAANAQSPKSTIADPAEVNELKSMLVQKEQDLASLAEKARLDVETKDKQIATLQAQKKGTTTVVTQTVSNDGEWKQKYTKLKASNDNLVSQNASLNKSYQAVVDDNRRLLSQVKSSRKE